MLALQTKMAYGTKRANRMQLYEPKRRNGCRWTLTEIVDDKQALEVCCDSQADHGPEEYDN